MSENHTTSQAPVKCPDCQARTVPDLTWCPQCYRDLLPEPALPAPRPGDTLPAAPDDDHAKPAAVHDIPADAAQPADETAPNPDPGTTGTIESEQAGLVGADLDDESIQKVDQMMAMLILAESAQRQLRTKDEKVKLAVGAGVGLTAALLVLLTVVGLFLR